MQETNTFQSSYFSQIANISEYIANDKEVQKAVSLFKELRKNKGKLFIIGSGGGAGHASHATCDFRKLCGLEVCCPTDNVSELTARINDEGWDNSLVGCMEAMRISSKDLLLVFSVGGGDINHNISVNLVRAIQHAKSLGCKVIGIVGRSEGYTAQVADARIIIPVEQKQLLTPITESFQAIIWHYFASHPELQQNPTKWEEASHLKNKAL